MKSVEDFVNEMVSTLRSKDPAASVEVGTPERKIIEAVATVLARHQVDYSVLRQANNIDLMAGGRLDSFLGTILRFGRQSATTSQGVVRFQRTSAAVQPVVIPRGTQLRATIEGSDYPDIPFQTIEVGVIQTGDSYVDIPVQSMLAGSIANVPSGAISGFIGLRTQVGVNSVFNPEPTYGGEDAESDERYRTRFKNQFFRNISGTYDQYLALAVSLTGVSKANVVGPISRYSEHIQVPTITPGVNEVQQVSVPASVSAWQLRILDENSNVLTTTADLGASPTASAVQTEVNSKLNTYFTTTGVTYVTVTRSGSNPLLYLVTFINRMGGRNLAMMTTTGVSGGSVTITQTTAGAAPSGIDAIQSSVFAGYDYHSPHLVDKDPLTWAYKATTEVSSIPYSKHTYQDNFYLTDSTVDPATALFFRPNVDFIFNTEPLKMSQGVAYSETTYEVGDLVRGNGNSGSGRMFVCVGAGSTVSNPSPTWVTVDPGFTTVGTANFKYLGPTTAPGFKTSTVYSLNDLVQIGTYVYRCSVGGTTAGTVPAPGPSNFTSNTAQFEFIGILQPYNLGFVLGKKPNVTILGRQQEDGTLQMPLGLESGSVVLLEHQYMSDVSRNVPDGRGNCVDIFVNGSSPQFVSSVEVVPPTTDGFVFTDSDPTKWAYHDAVLDVRFTRIVDSEPVGDGNLAMPLYWVPLLEVPNSITVADNTFYRANYYNPANSTYYNEYEEGIGYSVVAHYAGYQELGPNFGSVRARDGIEWFLSGPNHVDGDAGDEGTPKKIDELSGTQFTVVNYLFDQNIKQLQSLCERNKQITTDPLAHRATPRYFTVNVTVMYQQGANQNITDIAIAKALSTYWNSLYFGAAIQLSDILAVIHSVPGVDNVRWTNDVDPGVDKIEETTRTGVATGDVFNTDFILRDNELPFTPTDEALGVTIVRRATNTWGS